jgi:hypothetical protein
LRRGMVGIRRGGQHMGLRLRLRSHRGQSPLSVVDVPRISDPAAVGRKVVPLQRARPAASRMIGLRKTTGNRVSRLNNSPASVQDRILSTDEPKPKSRGTQKHRGGDGKPISE